jgi:DNA-binding MarR family transcriptional regulator
MDKQTVYFLEASFKFDLRGRTSQVLLFLVLKMNDRYVYYSNQHAIGQSLDMSQGNISRILKFLSGKKLISISKIRPKLYEYKVNINLNHIDVKKLSLAIKRSQKLKQYNIDGGIDLIE